MFWQLPFDPRIPQALAVGVCQVHLCALLRVQDRPDDNDGYTGDDWERWRAEDRAADESRMARRGWTEP